MAKARNRNLGGIAALGALGLAMARLGKKGPDEAEPPVDDRGDMMVTPAANTSAAARDTSTGAASPAAPVRANRGPAVDEDGHPLNDEGQRFYLGAASAPTAPGRQASTRQNSAAAAAPMRASAPAARASAPSAAVSQAAPARPAASAASAAQPAASAAQPASSPQAAPAASAARSNSKGLTLGTPTRPDPRAPSIYAGPEAWAAYRQRQAAGMKKGGTVKMASGGSVSNASRRGDGIAQRGKTRGRLV